MLGRKLHDAHLVLKTLEVGQSDGIAPPHPLFTLLLLLPLPRSPLLLFFVKKVDLYAVTVAIISGKLKKKNGEERAARACCAETTLSLCVCACVRDCESHILAMPDLIGS